MNISYHRIVSICTVGLLAVATAAPVGGNPIDTAQGKPVKVYILAGQSNMVEIEQVKWLKAKHLMIRSSSRSAKQHSAIDEVAIWGRHLTAEEIRALFNNDNGVRVLP